MFIEGLKVKRQRNSKILSFIVKMKVLHMAVVFNARYDDTAGTVNITLITDVTV